MKFEENFPSLKGKEIYFNPKIDTLSSGEKIKIESIGYEKSDVEKHCLDKQWVSDVIEKIKINRGQSINDTEDQFWLIVKDLKKELGI